MLCSLKPGWKRYTQWQWQRRLRVNHHVATLSTISHSINGFSLSRSARTETDACEYVYGEIDSTSWIALLSLTHPNPNTIFYDLGSGTGKTVLACAMVFDVKKSCGIELFPILHHAALDQLAHLKAHPDYQICAQNIEFICGDFLVANLADATLIFLSATGLFGDLWLQINQHLEQLTQRPLIITTTKRLISPKFQLRHQTRVQMSWGVVNAYIQQM